MMSNVKDETMMFKFGTDDDKAAKALCISCRAMLEKGYNPINQLVGYLLSDDPASLKEKWNLQEIKAMLVQEEGRLRNMKEHSIHYTFQKGASTSRNQQGKKNKQKDKGKECQSNNSWPRKLNDKSCEALACDTGNYIIYQIHWECCF